MARQRRRAESARLVRGCDTIAFAAQCQKYAHTFASRVKGEFEPAGESGRLIGASGKGLPTLAIVVMIERGNVCFALCVAVAVPIPLHCARKWKPLPVSTDAPVVIRHRALLVAVISTGRRK